MNFFATSPRSFKPLLATLIILPLLKSFAVGKSLLPNTASNGYKLPNCSVAVETAFPQGLNISLIINTTDLQAKVVSDVSKRSTSPWDYSIDEDPNRYPRTLSEAKCRHYGCVDARGRENYSMSSVPIYQEILVLRRQYKGCEQTYQLEKQLVTVGCTCARQRSY